MEAGCARDALRVLRVLRGYFRLGSLYGWSGAGRFESRSRSWLNAAHMLDEDLHDETIGFAVVDVMVALAHFADARELRVTERTAAVAKYLERILGLA